MSAAAVLVCALDVLGRSPSTLPTIELLSSRPPGVASNVEAFVRPGSGVISLLTTSEVFETALRSECSSYDAVHKLASIIVHEEWHVLNGADEHGAYNAQLTALLRLGVAADSGLYRGVVRSMLAVASRS